MRTSLKRTTPAVLRSIIGIKDIEWAEILNCSTATIHSVESGRLRLSDELARKMAHESGVALSWLLDGEVEAEPISKRNEPYTREAFDQHRALRDVRAATEGWMLPLDAMSLYGQMRAILSSADSAGNYPLARYKVAKMLKALAVEFGQDRAVYSGDLNNMNLSAAAKLAKADAKVGADLCKSLVNINFTGRMAVVKERVAARIAASKRQSKQSSPGPRASSSKSGSRRKG